MWTRDIDKGLSHGTVGGGAYVVPGELADGQVQEVVVAVVLNGITCEPPQIILPNVWQLGVAPFHQLDHQLVFAIVADPQSVLVGLLDEADLVFQLVRPSVESRGKMLLL